MPQRLPIVNSDDGTWGDIIRQYLMKEHYNDDTDNPVNGGHHKITIRAGTASAGTAPLKFTSGTLLTTPEAGAIEFNTDRLYFTQTTGPTRKTIAAYDDSSGATGDIYYRNSSGYFTRLAVGSSGDILTVASGIPSWTASIVGKVLDNTNTITVKDANFTLQDDTDTTKQLKFQLSGIATSTTRTWSFPNADSTFVGTDATQTLTNKTISGSSNTISNISASSVTNGTLPRSVIGIQDFTNLAAGSDFEGTHPWSLGTNWSIDTVQFHSGAKSLKHDSSVSGSSTLQGTFQVQEGERLYIELWARHDAAYNGTDGNSKLRVANQADNSLVSAVTFGTTSIPSADTWTKRTNRFTVPSGVTAITFALTDDGTAGNVWVDDIVIRRVPAYQDSDFIIQDNNDVTKQLQFEVGVITTGTTRTLTVPNASTTIVGTDVTQTLTNKTLTDPRINAVKDTNGNTVIGLAATASAVNYLTLVNSGAGASPNITANGSDANLAIYLSPKGNSGVNIYTSTGVTPRLSATGIDTNLNLNLVPKGTGVVQANGVEVATISGAQTLTNKTISGSSNTISDIAQSSITNLTTDLSSTKNLAVGQIAAGKNLVSNPGFEKTTFYHGNGSFSTEQKYAGTYSRKVTHDGTNYTLVSVTTDNTTNVAIPCAPGTVLYCEAWVYGHASNVNTTQNLWFQAQVILNDTTSTWITCGHTAADTALNGIWTKISGYMTTPANCANVSLIWLVGGNTIPNGNIYYWDDPYIADVTESNVINKALYNANTPSSTVLASVIPNLDASKITTGTFAQSMVTNLTTDLAAKVTGPASVTDNRITRYDGTTGKLVQNSLASIDDSGNAIFGIGVGGATTTPTNIHLSNNYGSNTPGDNANLKLTLYTGYGIGISGGRLEIQSGSNTTFYVSGTQIMNVASTGATISVVGTGAGSVVSIDGTQTLTGKTISASSNTISNIAVSNLAASAVVTEAEGIPSNDNDNTLPTSAAVKDYVDNNVSLSSLGVTASAAELNVLDGVTASTAELNYTDGVTSPLQHQLTSLLENRTGNLVIDPMFENDACWANAWGAQTTDQAYSGTKSRQLTATGAGVTTDRIILTHDGTGTPLYLNSGAFQSLGVRLRLRKHASNTSNDSNLYIRIHYIDTAGTEQTLNTTTIAESSISSSGWTGSGVVGSSTSSMVKVFVSVEIDAAVDVGNVFYLDSVVIVDSSILTGIANGIEFDVNNLNLQNNNTYWALDNLFTLMDNTDTTKTAQFQLSNITTGTARTYTLPDASGTLALAGQAISKYTQTIGDGSSTSIAVTHNLGTQDCGYFIRDASTNEVVDCDVTFNSASQATFTFATAPATNSLRVVIFG